jgi:hypothetical protein
MTVCFPQDDPRGYGPEGRREHQKPDLAEHLGDPMSKTVTISDSLAALVEAHRRAAGLATDEELCALIDEADASGPAELWDAAAVKAEVLRRYAALKGA